jgi:hypothetical protein
VAESLHQAGEFITKHKVALGVGGAAIVLWLILRGGSSSASSGGGTSTAQIAQLEAAQNIQMAQLQAQQNVASLGAQFQMIQNSDALQAHQDDLAAQIAATAYSANVENTKTNAQAALYHDLITTGEAEQLATLHVQSDLGAKAIALSGHENYKSVGANELALILGQGDVSSFNSANASTHIADTITQGSIIKSIIGGASNVVGSLFGGL